MRNLYADFNNFDQHGNMPLNCAGSLESINNLENPLEEGEEVWLSDGELRTRARVYYCADGIWEARGEFVFEEIQNG